MIAKLSLPLVVGTSLIVSGCFSSRYMVKGDSHPTSFNYSPSAKTKTVLRRAVTIRGRSLWLLGGLWSPLKFDLTDAIGQANPAGYAVADVRVREETSFEDWVILNSGGAWLLAASAGVVWLLASNPGIGLSQLGSIPGTTLPISNLIAIGVAAPFLPFTRTVTVKFDLLEEGGN